jgi:hypothetical protein
MKDKRLFLRWALFMSLIAIGGFIAAGLGWAGYVTDDPTHVTFVTLGVFFLATAWCGYLCWRLSNGHDPEDVRHALDHGWFASSLCVSMGLIGTAIGYYMMLKNGNAGGEPSAVIRQAFAHTSVAIINTVTGAVCGVIVEIQSHFIGHAVKNALRRAGKPVPEDAS